MWVFSFLWDYKILSVIELCLDFSEIFFWSFGEKKICKEGCYEVLFEVSLSFGGEGFEYVLSEFLVFGVFIEVWILFKK